MSQAKPTKYALGALFAFLLVLVGAASLFTFSSVAQADYVQPTDSDAVNPNYLFDMGIKLDPDADTSGFSIEIIKDGNSITPPSGFVRIPSSAEIDNQPYRSKDAWTSTHYMFMNDNAGRTADTMAFWFDDPTALDGATIRLTYPNIGTYYGEPVGMSVDITNIVFMRHPFSEAVMHAGNPVSWTWGEDGAINGLAEGSAADTFVAGPAMIISTLPQYGIFQWNIHQDDFQVSFFKSSDASRTPIADMEDLYLTYNSLSVYPLYLHQIPGHYEGWPFPDSYLNGGNNGDTSIMQFEKVKALSPLSKAYVTTDTHVYTGGGAGTHGVNDSYADTAMNNWSAREINGKTYYVSDGSITANGEDTAGNHGYTVLADTDADWPYYWTESGEYAYDGSSWQLTNRDNIEDPNAYNDRMGTSLFTRNSVSLQYADSADIRFRMNTPDNSFWFTLYPQALTGAVPGRPEIAVDFAPHKGVAKQGEDSLTGSDEAFAGDKVRYEVSQVVNSIGHDASSRYTNLQIVADIPEGVTLDDTSSFTITSSAGNEPQGSFSVDGNQVTYTFNTDYLASDDMPMAGETYTIGITGTVADSAKGKTLSASAKTILNTPNSTEEDSNDVSNPGRVAFSNVPAELKVSANDATNTSLKLANRGDTFTFQVEKFVPEDAETVTFEDTLDSVLEVVGNPSIDGAATYNVAIDGNKVTATTADATADRGKVVILTIDAKVADTATDEQLAPYIEAGGIPNTATVKVNDNPLTSNTVKVIPPTEPEIEKKVATSKAEINNKHGDLASIEEVYTYTIETSMPSNAKGFKVTDTIDDVLAFDGSDADIKVTVGGKAAGTAKTSGQTLTVKFTEEEVAANAGAAVVVEFKAKIKVSDADLVKKYADRTVPNKASYTITNLEGKDLDPKDSNTVTVTPPTPTPDPETGSVRVEHRVVDTNEVLIPWKFVQENQPGGTPYETSNEVTITKDGKTYTFVRIDENYEKATGEVVAGKTLDVVYLYELKDPGNNGNKDPETGSVRVQHITTTGKVLKDWADVQRDQPAGTDYETAQETFPGYEFVRMDPNSADANGTVVANTTLDVIYVYQPIGSTPEKAVNGGESAQLKLADEEFTYTVSYVVPGDTKELVVSDTLEDVLEFVGTPAFDVEGAKVAVDGQTVTATVADASGLAGKTVTLTFKARIKDGVTEQQLVEAYGADMDIPNQASVAINGGEPKMTNTVVVTPPAGFERIERTPGDPNPENPGEEENVTPNPDPESPTNPGTPTNANSTPTVRTSTSTAATPRTVTATTTASSTPASTPVKSGDSSAPAVLALGLVAAASLCMGAFSLRRRNAGR